MAGALARETPAPIGPTRNEIQRTTTAPKPKLRLWSRKARITLGTKYVTVEARDPPASARRDVEITDRALDMRRDGVPVKLRILVHEVRRRPIAELPVQTDFFKLIIKGIYFSQIVRVAKLADEIRGA